MGVITGPPVQPPGVVIDSVLAGAGLIASGSSLAVGAGNGITVNADDVALAEAAAGAGLTYTNGVLAVVAADTTLTVNADSMQVNLASTAFGWTAAHTLTLTAIGTAQTPGYSYITSTAAAAGAQQYSPMVVLQGNGWKTDGTPASQTVAWGLQTRPVQGASAPTSVLDIMSSINGVAYAAKATLTSGGAFTTTGAIQFVGSVTASNGAGGMNFGTSPNRVVLAGLTATYSACIQGWVAAATTTQADNISNTAVTRDAGTKNHSFQNNLTEKAYVTNDGYFTGPRHELWPVGDTAARGGLRITSVTKAYNSDLFNAAGLTDNATIFSQPANSILIAAYAVLGTQFDSTGDLITDLDVTIGDGGNNAGILNATGNYISDAAATAYKTKGAYFDATAGTLLKESATTWTAYATAVGANLNTLTAGSVTFYFVTLEW